MFQSDGYQNVNVKIFSYFRKAANNKKVDIVYTVVTIMISVFFGIFNCYADVKLFRITDLIENVGRYAYDSNEVQFFNESGLTARYLNLTVKVY